MQKSLHFTGAGMDKISKDRVIMKTNLLMDAGTVALAILYMDLPFTCISQSYQGSIYQSALGKIACRQPQEGSIAWAFRFPGGAQQALQRTRLHLGHHDNHPEGLTNIAWCVLPAVCLSGLGVASKCSMSSKMFKLFTDSTTHWA